MRNLWLFIKDVGHHWVALATGSAVIALVGAVEHSIQKSLTAPVYLALVGFLLLYACFLAWLDEYTKVDGLTTKVERLTKGLNDGATELARLRSRAVNALYAKKVSNRDDVPAWISKHDAWREEVLEVLRANFSEAIVLSFAELGEIGNKKYVQAHFNNHNHRLNMLSRQLQILEGLIAKYAPEAKAQ